MLVAAFAVVVTVACVLVCSALGGNRRQQAELEANLRGLAEKTGRVINSTVLDEYISFADENFEYVLDETITRVGYVAYKYIYTSLRYLNDSQVDRPIWRHQLSIIIPNTITTNVAYMLTDYGYNDESPDPSNAATQVAVSVGAIVGELRAVPNQVLCFTQPLPDDPYDGDYCLDEDFLMSYGMEWFMRESNTPAENPLWLARLGMVKASVWANTILQQVALQRTGRVVEEFFIYGASKRGATVWLVAAVDTRVIGVNPIVIDTANWAEMANRRYMALGPRLFNEQNMYHRTIGWSRHVDGVPFGLIDDPYYYFGRLEHVHKLFQFAASDAYFEPDQSRFWWNDLPGSKLIRYTPMLHYDFYLRQNEQIIGNMIAWSRYVMANRTLPVVDWTVAEGTRAITMRILSGETPSNVYLVSMNNPETAYRTFSPLHGAPTNWELVPLQPQSPGVYHAYMDTPAQGWTGFFIQMEFATGYTGAEESLLRISSLVSIIPDVWPYPPCPNQYCNCGPPENCEFSRMDSKPVLN